MPPYHSISGTDITVYLDIQVNTAGNFEPGIPLDHLMRGIAVKWNPIAAAHGFRLIIAPSESPGMDELFPSPLGTALIDNAGPNDRILYHNDVVTPPAGVEFFKLKIGLKDTAHTYTQGAKISHVSYAKNHGYIYSQGPVPSVDLNDIGHELAHILGLVDRYYEAIAWYSTKVIERTCRQIRFNDWFDSDHVDRRVAVPATTPDKRPIWAERGTLLMHKNALKDKDGKLIDSEYVASDNLMSSSSSTLTKHQLEFIGIKDGQAQTPQVEPEINTAKWIAVLGDRDNPQYHPFSTWDGGKGLMYYPNDDESQTAESYPCWNGSQSGRDAQGKVRPDLIEDARGKKYQFIRILPKRYHEAVKKRLVVVDYRNEMCYCKRLLSDLD